jgi:hypothetical protein
MAITKTMGYASCTTKTRIDISSLKYLATFRIAMMLLPSQIKSVPDVQYSTFCAPLILKLHI